MLFYQISASTIHKKKFKEVIKKINLKQQLQRRINLMDHILYQTFKITLSILSKNMKK